MWIKLDDAMLDNPKVAAAGPIGFALHVAAIIYSARNLTDGFVPYGHARRLLAVTWTEEQDTRPYKGARVCTLAVVSGMSGSDGDEVIEHMIPQLCSLGLWEEAPHGYLIHDYLDYNPSKDEVLAMRAERSESGRKGGQASAQAKAQAVAKASAQAKSNPVPVPAPVTVLKEPSVGSLQQDGLTIESRGWTGGEESTAEVLGRFKYMPRKETA